jgi:serine phosphatase RsbU (regulator of sigma subunit)
MECLDISDGKSCRRVELTQSRLLIGRDATCDIHLPHLNVSRRHAQQQRSPEGLWLLQDLGSLNHVFVGGRPIKQVVLQHGMEIQIAEYRLTFLTSSTITAPVRPTNVDAAAPWRDLDHGWLDDFFALDQALNRQAQPRQVLECLAQEFSRIAQPQVVAVGTGSVHFHWDVMISSSGDFHEPDLDEGLRRASSTDSDVQVWIQEEEADRDTPYPGSAVCLLFPMKGRSGIIGHVFVQRPRCYPLLPQVQRYLALLARHAGLICDNLELAALRDAQRQIEHELRQARQIQTELFPVDFNVHPRLNVYAVNLPSVRISGDYYDVIRLGSASVAFVIADAMGHGMPAALLMSAVRAGLRMGLFLNQPWDEVFQGLDHVVTQARAGAFVTGILGLIDLHRNELQIVSAGHLFPSIVVAGRSVFCPEDCQTRPWGLDFSFPWQVGRIDLGSADWSILCYTDGILDPGSGGAPGLDTAGVAAYHVQHHHLSAEDLAQGLLGEAAAFQSSSSLADDQTVLVLRSS